MRELEQILELWARAESAGEAAVLATVVKTQGSAYRLPGARMLVTAGSLRAGSISGGCLEEDLLKKAWWLTEAGPVVRRYDTTPDGEIAAEYGLGCNGIIYVLLERVSAGHAPVLDLIHRVRAERRPAAIVHLLQPKSDIGQRVIVDTAGTVAHNLADPDLASALLDSANHALAEGASRHEGWHGVEAFVETLAPAVRLVIFGAGDDAVPMTALAKHLGWRVTVCDGRSHYARVEKFPLADEVFVRPAGASGLGAEIDPWTVAILMTHSYSQDLEALRELAGEPLRYLGILGPRKRTVQLLADAGLHETKLAPVLHAPIGLDIGADGPEQVALAAIAEIQATLNSRQGGLLRERSGSIHARDSATPEDESYSVPSIACAS